MTKAQKETIKHEVKSYLVYVVGLLFSYFIAELIAALSGLQTFPTWETLLGIIGSALSISALKLTLNGLGWLNHSVLNPINLNETIVDKNQSAIQNQSV